MIFLSRYKIHSEKSKFHSLLNLTTFNVKHWRVLYVNLWTMLNMFNIVQSLMYICIQYTIIHMNNANLHLIFIVNKKTRGTIRPNLFCILNLFFFVFLASNCQCKTSSLHFYVFHSTWKYKSFYLIATCPLKLKFNIHCWVNYFCIAAFTWNNCWEDNTTALNVEDILKYTY